MIVHKKEMKENKKYLKKGKGQKQKNRKNKEIKSNKGKKKIIVIKKAMTMPEYFHSIV